MGKLKGEVFCDALELCRTCCGCNADVDAIYNKIPTDVGIKYMCENDDEFKKDHEKQKAIELRAKLEKEGKEIQPTQNQRIIMSENKKLVADSSENENLSVNSQSLQTQNEIETKRINKLKEKEAKTKSSFKYKIVKKDSKMIGIQADFKDKDLTPLEQHELQMSTICAATGSASNEYSQLLFSQTCSAFFRNEVYDADFNANAAKETLLALNPKDEIEGMLCSRLLVLHDQYMNFMARNTNPKQTGAGVDLNVNRSTKLMRLYNETLEALNRYRRKGEQRVVVQHQHVNVNEGGQAVVGSHINQQGGGANGKK